MHPSCLKLIINQLAVNDLGMIQMCLRAHEENLEKSIRNKNFGPYKAADFEQDLQLTNYILEYVTKSLQRRMSAPPL